MASEIYSFRFLMKKEHLLINRQEVFESRPNAVVG